MRQTFPLIAVTTIWAGFCLAITTTPGNAQQTSGQSTISVPPPPSLVPVPAAPSSSSTTSSPNETVFQAPPDVQRANPGRYLVYVNGDSPYLLQQVQTVVPQAYVQQFQGRSVIQVGTFNDETNARRQVELLQAQGVVGNIAPLNTTSFPPTVNHTSPYLVVIPGQRESLPSLAQQAMRLGVRQEAIQMKEAPLGPHLSIGPFTEYGEAKEVSKYLRDGGLDSRVYFSK